MSMLIQKWDLGICILILASTLSACSRHGAPTAELVEVDYASRLMAAGLSGTALLDADRDMRVGVTTQLKSAIINHYVNLELKNSRIKTDDGKPFDSIKHLDNCIAIEANSNDTSDINFMDRMRICVAAFQDTHFSATSRTPMPGVTTGLLLRNIGGRYFITARQPDLLDYAARAEGIDDFEKITAVGNEVLEVDGQSPAALSTHYQKFIASSSPAHRQIMGDLAILSRYFDYPTKRTVRLKIKSPTETYNFELPWWAGLSTRKRLDTSTYFQKIGIPVSDRVRMLVKPDGEVDWKKAQLSFKGYLDSESLINDDPFRPILDFKEEDGEVAARFGTVVTSTQSFCYSQLLTFSAPKMTSPDGKTLPFLETYRRFVKSCKEAKLNLVIDLRSNGGGNGNFPSQMLAMLAPAGASYPNKVASFRVNSTALKMISSWLEFPEIIIKDLGDSGVRLFDEIQAAASAGLSMTNAVPDSDGIKTDEQVGGYDGKIVVLVTPNCVSACDGLAALLKRSGRGIILGTHTNGTGAGFISSKDLDSNFEDTYSELSMKIPNYQFGYSTKAFPDLVSLPYASVQDSYFTENKPTFADIIVEPTHDDILGKKNTWLEATLKALQAP